MGSGYDITTEPGVGGSSSVNFPSPTLSSADQALVTKVASGRAALLDSIGVKDRTSTVMFDTERRVFYFGTSGRYGAPANWKSLPAERISFIKNVFGSLKPWPAGNCAEQRAFNNALFGGSKPENLIHATFNIQTGRPMPSCWNCRWVTFGTRSVTGSEPWPWQK
jgi:hypothetical protein